MNEYHDRDYLDSCGSWDDPFSSHFPCPWGGIGSYQPADEQCDWECPYRQACIRVKKSAQQQRLRMQIINEVNQHPSLIAAWRKLSFKERCLAEKRRRKRNGGLLIR